MNERIRELAEQNANEIADLFTPGFFDDRMVADVANISKKFAELIVWECIFAVEDAGGIDKYHYTKAITEHFGVEE